MPNINRLDEIATQALCFLEEVGLLDDFLEDKYIDLTPDEREYFCLEEEYEDEEDVEF